MPLNDYILIGCLCLAGIASVWAGTLQALAGVAGVLVSIAIYKGTGYTGLICLAVFFLLGTLATKWQIHKKQQLGLAEQNKGKRNAGQVMANAAMAGILGLFAWLFPVYASECTLLVAACFSSATADTLSSEMGNLYGKHLYNILSFKKDIRGQNGVVSLEGTMCGLAGSSVIALIHAAGMGWHTGQFIIIVIAGTVGNLVDSLLGASLERKHIIGNNIVNFLNTFAAALVAWLCLFL